MSYYVALKLNTPTAERRMAAERNKVQLGELMRYVRQQSARIRRGIGITGDCAGGHRFEYLTQLEMTWGHTPHCLSDVSGAHLGDR